MFYYLVHNKILNDTHECYAIYIIFNVVIKPIVAIIVLLLVVSYKHVSSIMFSLII